MSPGDVHESFMRRAIDRARKGWGRTHPNPMVGAVIVEGGRVSAEGFHSRDGAPHAEREAIGALGRKPAPDATLYVTLEPCSTKGRTGACTEAIVAAGIRRVVAGATDPFPAHAGRGFEVLRAAGVEVVTGVLESECADLNLIYNHFAARGAPLIAGKLACTLDGRIATRTGESKWITGEQARQDVHRWRRLFPAIAVGAGTVSRDDPRLTARIDGEPEWCPQRIVFDGQLSTVGDGPLARVYTDEFRERTTVVTTRFCDEKRRRRLEDLGIGVWTFETESPVVSISDFRKRCVEARIAGVFVEGGSMLLCEMLRARALDYFFVYRSPKIMGDEKSKPALSGFKTEDLASCVHLADVKQEAFGEDGLARGRVVYPDTMELDSP